ncbi:archaea-specific SMC-related protein [Haloplanus pelagicus]|jgi:DNA repair exonuclease SbcCD ATPase subunit|uniref:archaea-specific SMC-related protein n=1 Tax=Haloplanus pelagicus TaxID=2949995 RepID=UPI00203A5991|nr:archaea-specific SMC-related protein [Haloplanus sp. HW8-1]
MTADDSNADGDWDGDEDGERLAVSVRNVGGIEHASASFDPGVTVVTGENASNKSSLLGSLGAVLGGSHPPLRGGAETGTVALDLDGERYELDLVREEGETVVAEATPYTGAATLVDCFVRLDEDNPIRRAVVAGSDLHDLLMRPIDTEEIDAEIEELRGRRDNLDERLAALDEQIDTLPELEVRARRLREEHDEVTTRLEEKRAALSEMDRRAAAEETRDLLDDLEDARTERERLRDRQETKRRAIDSLEDDLASVEADLSSLAADVDGGTVRDRLDGVDAELTTLRERKGRLDETIDALRPIVEVNQALLADSRLPEGFDESDVVDRLDPASEAINCWTCGQSVERGEIREQIEAVESILQGKREERKAVEARIEERQRTRADLEARLDERAELEERRRCLERQIEDRERALSGIEERIETVEERIRDLEANLAEAETDDDLLHRHREVSDLEYERGRLERELAAVEDDIEAAEAARSEADSLRAERAEVSDRLADLRERIDRIEREAVETVNECMARVLDRLDYRAIERVWIDRRETDGETAFDLQVVRTTDDGTVYRAAVDTLSKSEREVVGLVIALAGYLVHDVAASVPVVVVDAIEMLDAERIRGLLDFFDEHARYVVAAVLPEEADRLRTTFDTVALETPGIARQ